MSDPDPSSLLGQAHHARTEAERARRLRAGLIPDDQIALSRFADEMDARAVEFEEQAFNLRPGVLRQAIPEQMQQAQSPPAKTDDAD